MVVMLLLAPLGVAEDGEGDNDGPMIAVFVLVFLTVFLIAAVLTYIRLFRVS